jgi:hypothetical protein
LYTAASLEYGTEYELNVKAVVKDKEFQTGWQTIRLPNPEPVVTYMERKVPFSFVGW